VFIGVISKLGFRELIKQQLALLKEEELTLSVKHTIPGYTKKGNGL